MVGYARLHIKDWQTNVVQLTIPFHPTEANLIGVSILHIGCGTPVQTIIIHLQGDEAMIVLQKL